MSPTIASTSEADLVSHAVRELARRTRFPVAFGGLLQDGAVSVTSIVGARTHSIDGLQVRPERGLGGRAMTEKRPRMTGDYGSSRHITHDYDGYILGEGLRTLLAIPIVVDGRTRGVLYAGTWEGAAVGGITTAPAVTVAESVAAELRIRDEVDRRVRARAASTSPITTPHREELRESFAELRSISAGVTDDRLRSSLARLERRLLNLAGEDKAAESMSTAGSAPAVHLSPRETDVLSCVALGRTNTEIAAQLTLREGTVKAYLSTAMSKLGASTRHAAVISARRSGILP